MKRKNTNLCKYLLFTLGAVVIAGLALYLFTPIANQEHDNELVTVTIPNGLRKEQTADILANAFNWSVEQETKFVVEDTARDALHAEGVLPGGTYKIAAASSTYEVASLFLDRARERQQKLGGNLTSKEWYEVLKVAAIAEREADTLDEMEAVARSIWQNRNGYIRSDATVQYVRDSLAMYPNKPCTGQDTVVGGMVEYTQPADNNGAQERTVCLHWRLAYTKVNKNFDWWQPITEADKRLDHGYNTYLYEGLPQHPIATPSIGAIETVLAAQDANQAAVVPTEDETIEPNDIAGTYTAAAPVDASSSERRVTLILSPMQPGVVVGARASFTIDYSNDEPSVTSIGGWEMTEEGNVAVSAEPESSAGGSGTDVTEFIFQVDGDTLTAIEYDEDMYELAGIELTKK